MTLSEENYLKAIFHLAPEADAMVATNAIAHRLETKASSVTDMVKKLSDKGLLTYVPYQGARLSKKGRQIAVNIIRKHRLWELFLVEKLNFSWDEVHEVAEQLEHIKSPKLVEQLDDFLGNPKVDPHGDPIPDKEGNIPVRDHRLLSVLKAGDRAICVGVKDSDANFLKYLNKHGIALGEKIEVIDKEPFDESMLIRVRKKEIRVSQQIATNIYIETR